MEKRDQQAKIFSPEDMEAVKKELKERGIEIGERSPEARAEESVEEKQRAKQILKLEGALTEVKRDIQLKRSELTRLQRRPGAKTYYEGMEERPIDPKDIERLEDEMIGLHMKQESLTEAIQSLTTGGELPADIEAVLKSFEK